MAPLAGCLLNRRVGANGNDNLKNMTEEFMSQKDAIVEKCCQLADLLEELEEMAESDEESLEDANVDLQQISDCLEEVYGIREVFDAAEDMPIEDVRALATKANPIVLEDDFRIQFRDGTVYRIYPYDCIARKVKG